MYEIRMDVDTAVAIRDALRVAIERWAGGKPSEQERLFYLETEFNKMILEHSLDAWRSTMERGLSLLWYVLMSILARFISNQKKRAQRYHTDALRYRGVVYKEIDWWCRGGSIPPPVIGKNPIRRAPLVETGFGTV